MLNLRKRSAFTLIELLIVVIIVAVLAAVGVPMLSANVARAKATEAEAGLGSIRTVLRTIHAELGVYPTAAAGDVVKTKLATYFKDGDLDGKYYDEAAYKFLTATDADTFCVGIASPGTGIPARSMDQTGTLREESSDCTGTPLN